MKELLLIGCVFALFACTDKTSNKPQPILLEQEKLSDTTQLSSVASEEFSVNSIPYSEVVIGAFPYMTLPEGLKAQNKPFQKEYDVCFFPINGVMTPFEGKLYKLNVVKEPGKEFSKRYFEKSLGTYLESIGGVKVFEGYISKDEYYRYHKEDPNKGDEGDIGYFDEHITFYMIRCKDQGNIYVQYSADNYSGKLNVLQEKQLNQTIKKISSKEIVHTLNDQGKVVLYINFDINKATITKEGDEVVMQIVKALEENNSLAISIDGHTDDTGEGEYNIKLSKERADAVVSKLVQNGINSTRVSANGYGATRPLVPKIRKRIRLKIDVLN